MLTATLILLFGCACFTAGICWQICWPEWLDEIDRAKADKRPVSSSEKVNGAIGVMSVVAFFGICFPALWAVWAWDWYLDRVK